MLFRSDVYSLGCSLYYMLTGHAPFNEGTLPQRIMMHQHEAPPPIRTDRPDVPDDLVALCARMMAKKPNDRPQSAAEVAEWASRWLSAHGHDVVESGSSGKIPAVVAGPSASADDESAVAWRPKMTGRGPSRRSGPGSNSLAEVAAAAGDTVVDSRREPHREGASPSADEAPDDDAPLIEPAEEPVGALDFLAREPSPVLARLRSREPMTPDRLATYRHRQKGTPLSVWVVIGAGSLLAVVLALLLLLTR